MAGEYRVIGRVDMELPFWKNIVIVGDSERPYVRVGDLVTLVSMFLSCSGEKARDMVVHSLGNICHPSLLFDSFSTVVTLELFKGVMLDAVNIYVGNKCYGCFEDFPDPARDCFHCHFTFCSNCITSVPQDQDCPVCHACLSEVMYANHIKAIQGLCGL